MAVALISGITGHDGSYPAEFLLSRIHEVHGVVWPTWTLNLSRLDHRRYAPRAVRGPWALHLHYGDLSDAGSVPRLVWAQPSRRLQPGCPEAWRHLPRPARLHSRCVWTRGDPAPQSPLEGRGDVSLLLGRRLRTIRGNSAPQEGRVSIQAARPLGHRQAIRSLDDRRPPPSSRHVRLRRQPPHLQVNAARRGLGD